MKKKNYIQGFYERIDEACYNSGIPKYKIAKMCGFDRRVLMQINENVMMNSGNLARFCAVTKTDANWLLGLTGINQ